MKTTATHYIECFESVGGGKKRRLFQECIFLRYHGEDKAVVKVLKGIRGGKGGNLAYVDKNKLIGMYVQNTKIK